MEAKSILVVEDNRAIARLIQEVLCDVPGYGAVTVRNGAGALTVLGASEADLVLLDIDLPDISGLALYDRLRDDPRTARLPVLFMSAADYERELARRGVHDYLRKPFDLDDLLARVETLLAQPLPRDSILFPARDAG
jgi:DNA-binding response OmpR family regulator